MNKQQSGFTLIELVVVITLIGILAAVALPKFINIQTDARASVMKGVESSMRGAAAMVYSKALIAGVEGSATGSITVNGASVAIAYGYPDVSAINGLLNLQPLTDFITTTAGTVEYAKAATVGTTCAVIYTNATASTTTPPVITPPVITTTTAGC